MVVEMEEIVTLKELAYELGTTPKALRKWLRDHKIKKPGSRWEWLENDQRLEEIRQLRKGVKPGKPTKKEAEEKEPFIIESIGKWNIWKNPQTGAVQAVYQGPNTTDKTPWYTEGGQVRPSLPKKVKEAVLNNL